MLWRNAIHKSNNSATLISWLCNPVMESSERGINPVAMTIINPWKEYWASRGIEQATSCSQVLYATDWCLGLGTLFPKALLTWMIVLASQSYNPYLSNVSQQVKSNWKSVNSLPNDKISDRSKFWEGLKKLFN